MIKTLTLSIILQMPWNADEACFVYRPGCWADVAARLPPTLETLIWGPLWTRRYLDVGPNHKHRALLRRYAEDMLKGHPTLKDVKYLWNDEGYCHCYLLDGSMMEGWAEARDTDDDAWTRA